MAEQLDTWDKAFGSAMNLFGDAAYAQDTATAFKNVKLGMQILAYAMNVIDIAGVVRNEFNRMADTIVGMLAPFSKNATLKLSAPAPVPTPAQPPRPVPRPGRNDPHRCGPSRGSRTSVHPVDSVTVPAYGVDYRNARARSFRVKPPLHRRVQNRRLRVPRDVAADRPERRDVVPTFHPANERSVILVGQRTWRRVQLRCPRRALPRRIR